MNILGATRFDQCVISMALVNICNSASYIGQEMRSLYTLWKDETHEPVQNFWWEPHWFTFYVPHPDQRYEEVTLEQGLTLGYNLDVKPLHESNPIPYKIPAGGHFVVVLKQTQLNGGFEIVATGIFVRPLATLSLDLVVDRDQGDYQPIIITHPIIRDYPSGWEEQLTAFLQGSIHLTDLPTVVNAVDQTLNPDYRPPTWSEIYLSAKGFAGV